MFLKKIIKILGPDKTKLPLLVLLFIAMSLLDLVGIGLIAPFTSIVMDAENVTQSNFYLYLQSFGISLNRQKLVLFLTIFIMIIFVIKTFYALLINRKILNF